MATVVLNITSFRERFTAFSDETTCPDTTIQTTWDTATIYVSNASNNCFTDNKLELALQQMTAHLLTLQDSIKDGGMTGTVTSSTIDKVSVTLLAPTNYTEFEFWLNQTPYGQQLLALLSTVCAGGFYVGGNAPRLAYL